MVVNDPEDGAGLSEKVETDGENRMEDNIKCQSLYVIISKAFTQTFGWLFAHPTSLA